MAILGIDEVGRGPLAGPLVVGAVILPKFELNERGELISGPEWVMKLKDSKKLTAKKREELSEVILKEAPATGLGWVSAFEIDEIGMSEALRLATSRAVKSVQGLHKPFSQIVIDGKVNFLEGTALEKYVSTMPKADDLVKEVSAASIVAKVARDQHMVELASKYPGYGFEKHAGYGTEFHRNAIFKLGPCPEHRRSFEPIKSMVGFESSADESSKNTTLIGKKAELAVAEYLKEHDHMIVAQNFKNKFCEIDIVSVDINTSKIFFTEVKYRKDDTHGGGLMAVTPRKQEQMKFAVEVFLKKNPKFRDYDPLLTVASVSGEDFLVDDWFAI